MQSASGGATRIAPRSVRSGGTRHSGTHRYMWLRVRESHQQRRGHRKSKRGLLVHQGHNLSSERIAGPSRAQSLCCKARHMCSPALLRVARRVCASATMQLHKAPHASRRWWVSGWHGCKGIRAPRCPDEKRQWLIRDGMAAACNQTTLAQDLAAAACEGGGGARCIRWVVAGVDHAAGPRKAP